MREHVHCELSRERTHACKIFDKFVFGLSVLPRQNIQLPLYQSSVFPANSIEHNFTLSFFSLDCCFNSQRIYCRFLFQFFYLINRIGLDEISKEREARWYIVTSTFPLLYCIT